ncbi:MAG: rod shape-determining protein MreD [Candidatus Paracaedibacteraceae bacterium]|nr:rod shape-determining protein MreD [Candidatus Paracaedibacteraceae bacterium]
MVKTRPGQFEIMMNLITFRKYAIEGCFLSSLILLEVLPFWKKLGVVPNFLSIVVYLWALYRPDLISRSVFILLGICRDAMMGYPLGVGIIELMVISMVVSLFRRYVLEKGFWAVFLGFVLFSIMDTVLFWSVLSLAKMEALPLSGIIRPIIANILFYPIISLASLKIQQLIDSYPKKAFG